MNRQTEDNAMNIVDYFAILRRRRLLFLVPAALIAFATIIAAMLPDSIYRSQATILIEDQQIPEDIAGSTVTNYASQQVQLISQHLLTAASIQQIVERFDVYGDDGRATGDANEDYAEKFRDDMELELVSTEVIDPRARSLEAAIAFTLAFRSTDPATARDVTDELVALFLNENQRSGAVKTSGVSEYLRTAVDDANVQLLQTEAELAEFKRENEGALPEQYPINRSAIERTEQQISDVNLRIQQLEQRIIESSAQLVQLNPSAPVTLATGETIMSDQERLRVLLIEYRRKASVYEPDHPDFLRLKREIEALRATTGSTGDVTGEIEQVTTQLRSEREKLSSLRERYAENIPEIRSTENTIVALEARLEEIEQGATASQEVANNPAYLLIRSQLQSAQSEIQSLTQKRAGLETKLGDLEASLARAPAVEMRYEALLRSNNDAKTTYDELQAKLRAAKVAANVEEELSGQRFSLLDPPVLPREPVGPNRFATVLMGLVLALGAGAGCVAIAEALDKSIRGAKALTNIVGASPLVVIPYVENSDDLQLARTQRSYLFAIAIAASVLLIACMHFFVKPIQEIF